MATLETNGNSNPYGAQGKKTQMAGMTSRNIGGMHGDSQSLGGGNSKSGLAGQNNQAMVKRTRRYQSTEKT